MTETVEQKIQFLEQHLSSKPRSPLFAQLAGYYLDAGKTREALDLCDKGLSVYPFYSTGHLIKGKALLALNMPAEARREFELVQSRFVGIDSLTLLLQDLPSGGIETITASQEEITRVIKRAPAAKPAPPKPATAEANAEQLLSQFTEEAATAPAAEVQPQEAIAPAPEPAETFSFTAETPVESPAEVTAQSEEAFGIAAPTVEAPGEPPTTLEAPTETGEPFSDFVERKRGELYGLENSLSLDEYLGTGQPSAFEAPPQEAEAPAVEAPAAELPAEDPFAALTKQFEEPAVEAEPPQVSEPSTEDPFAQLQQLTEEAPALSAESTSEAITEDPFAQLSQITEETPAAPVAAEDVFTRQPVEEAPFATEDPFAQQPVQKAPAAPGVSEGEKDQIEALADKLKNAARITPIIDLSERAAVPPSESETPSSTGFVTPTLAEIYAKQGWYDDAIKAYKTLAVSKPAEREKFEKRIQELEELKKQQEPG